MYSHVNLLHVRINRAGTPLNAPGKTWSMWRREYSQWGRRRCLMYPQYRSIALSSGWYFGKKMHRCPCALKSFSTMLSSSLNALSSDRTRTTQQRRLLPASPAAPLPPESPSSPPSSSPCHVLSTTCCRPSPPRLKAVMACLVAAFSALHALHS
ncbi:unnamed protein product [Ectocarpus sp. CCAP 1310/34]|nr:unnamed protein product [Ectocarpus sp. CCAP 1310/34]